MEESSTGYAVGIVRKAFLRFLPDLLLVFPIIGNELQSCIVFL